jgi:hypothetical protein
MNHHRRNDKALSSVLGEQLEGIFAIDSPQFIGAEHAALLQSFHVVRHLVARVIGPEQDLRHGRGSTVAGYSVPSWEREARVWSRPDDGGTFMSPTGYSKYAKCRVPNGSPGSTGRP